MNDVWRSGLVSLVVLSMLVSVPGAAVAGWRMLPTTGFVASTPDLELTKTLTYLMITSQTGTRNLWVHQTVPTVEGDVIDGIAVCYSTFAFAPGDRPPFITTIRLTETLFPADLTVQHGDGTDLTSRTDTCYVSPVANYTPTGAVNLALELDFDPFDLPGGGPGIIYIGAVAVHVQ